MLLPLVFLAGRSFVNYVLFQRTATTIVSVQLQGGILMSFLSYSKQAQMNFLKLFELSFNTINGTIEQIPDWFLLF